MSHDTLQQLKDLRGILDERIQALEDKDIQPKPDPVQAVKKFIGQQLQWIAVDEDGATYAFEAERPMPNDGGRFCSPRSPLYLFDIPLNGADWRKCCWHISELFGNSEQVDDQIPEGRKMVEVPFRLDRNGEIVIIIMNRPHQAYGLYTTMKLMNIDQTKIKRILVEVEE